MSSKNLMQHRQLVLISPKCKLEMHLELIWYQSKRAALFIIRRRLELETYPYITLIGEGSSGFFLLYNNIMN